MSTWLQEKFWGSGAKAYTTMTSQMLLVSTPSDIIVANHAKTQSRTIIRGICARSYWKRRFS